jgi:DEAD/DEAH box helicase domain-containing protein
VDMGDLDLVMMTSVPPHPSNYKQRAGRSGRNNSSRSVCITLCGSDAVGLRTLYSPMEQLIHRPMAVPAVDLNSPQVIRRHVNAFLLRKSGVLFGKESNLNQMVIDFFTPFSFQKDVQFNNRPNYAQVEYKDDDDNVQMISAKSYNYQISERLSECPSLMCDQFVDYLNKLGEHQEDLKELSNLLKQTCLEVEKGCEMCKKDTERIKDEFIDSLDSIQNAYKDNEEDLNRGKEKKEKREKALKYKFSELLATPLISYFATHRFTPNANMPVNIISFDLSNMGKKDSNYWKYRYKNIGNNPSYPIQTALSQYAPGNTVVMDNKSVKVAGVDCANIYNPTKTYKTIYTDGSQTVVDFKEGLKGTPKNWSVNNKEGLTLIEPISFLPAADSEYTREEPQNRYTQVSAQLIGAGNWQVQNEKGLLAMRCNRDSGDAKILYYNEGIGFGYAFCTNCGKSVLETGIERKPSCCPGINDEEKNKGFYHYDITSSLKCEKGTIKRNVIFGGLIQTDYCEIKIKKEKNGSWITSKKDSDNLLTTLGVLFTQVFAEYIGINRGEIDFTITPNGHLCVFDTNPGGAGYSNQLADRLMMNDVLKNSLALLSGGENTAGRMVNPVKTKDELLDKITIRYLDKLDVEAAKTWMERESEDDDNDLKSVQHSYSNAQKVYLQDIYKAFRSEQNVEKMLFVNDDYDKWLYDPDSQDELGWRSRVDTIKQSAGDVKVCVCVCTQLPVPFKVYPWLRKMSDWSSVQKGIPEIKGDFYPLAKCGSRFFFTDCKDSAALNGHWGNSNIYCTDLKCRIEAKPINVNDEDKNRHFVIGREQSTTSRDLAGLVASKIGNDLLKRFGEHCKSSEKVKITYQDQHLKSVLGIVTTLQFIDYFIERFGIKSFDLNFENETYKDDSNRNRVDVNLIDSLERDEKLRKLTDIWLDNKSKQNVRGTMNILPQTSKKLPHWRELKFECGDCSLSLFPNGGIINEWFLDNKSNKCSKFYKNDNTTTEDAVPLHNRTEVMYDVILTEK